MTKAQIRKNAFSEIHSDHVQLHFSKHGIWDYDGKCRIWLVLFTVLSVLHFRKELRQSGVLKIAVR